MSRLIGNLPDEILVCCCARGSKQAWCVLFRQNSGKLLENIRRLRLGAGAEWAEEIAARVWVGLLGAGAAGLRAYDPRRSTVLAYLTELARQQLRTCHRQRRRRTREVPLAATEPVDPHGAEPSIDMLLSESVPRLSACEKAYFHHLIGTPNSGPPLSAAMVNQRKLKQRVLRKLRVYLQEG